MKKLIFIKIYFDILKFFIANIFIVGLIVWTIQAVNYFDFVTEDGHGLKIYFFYSLLNFPKIIHRILPFIFFISIFYILLTYELKNEISIFWINGIKKKKFLKNLVIFSIIFMFVQLILGSYISPLSKLKARNFLKNSTIDFFTSLIKERKFINITDGLTIFIEKKEPDGSFKNIFLEEVIKDKSKMIYADKGYIFQNQRQKILKLYNGSVINFENSKINLFNFEFIDFSLQNLNSKTITVPKIQEIDTKTLLSCFLLDIKSKEYDSFKCDENLKKKIKLELADRIYKPIFIPLITLFSCYLILYSKKESGYKLKIYLIFLINVFLIIYSEISATYLLNSSNLMFLYCLIPLIIFFIFYLYFFKLIKKNV